MKTAIVPGSFDPITLGHLNIIRRASRTFDRVVVCVVVNENKKPMFTLDERMDQIRRVTERLGNVTVDSWDGLIMDYARKINAQVVVRGLRALSDFEYEFQMALINKKINPTVETVFMASNEKYTYISSSAVKEMVHYGADVSQLVPREILEEVVQRGQKK